MLISYVQYPDHLFVSNLLVGMKRNICCGILCNKSKIYDSNISGAICVGFSVPLATKNRPFPSIDTLATTDLVEVVDLLCGRLSLMSLGDDMVEAMMKNRSNRKIMSVMDDMENRLQLLSFFDGHRFIPLILICYAGSFNKSRNSILLASNLRTTESTRETK